MSKAFFTVFLTIVTGGGTAILVWTLHAQSSNVTPFTASVREVFYRYPTGEYVTTQDSVIAMASDGSNVEVRHPLNPNGEAKEQTIITDMSLQKRIVADGLTESLTTTNINTPYLNQLKSDSYQCLTITSEHSNIMGYEAVKVTKQITAASGKVSLLIESWLAPSVSCLALKVTTSKKKGGGEWVLTNVREIQNITVGDPDKSLFKTPAGYSERSPSQVMDEFNRRFPSNPPAAMGAVEQRDKSYYLNHK